VHSYYDDDADSVDWDGINNAAEFIGRGLRFWRVDVRQWKEKFGTVRVYCSLGIQWWPQLTHPGYVYNQWPRWLDFITYGSYNRWSPLCWVLRLLNLAVVPFHAWLYKRYYREAIRRWPHLKEEILRGADFHELLGAKVKYSTIYWPELGDAEPTKPEWWDETHT